MVITLIGLSGCGKSYLAKRIEEERGFCRICCDDLVESRLEPILTAQGFFGIEGVATWMGKPHEAQSAERQSIYLSHERNIMQEIIRELGDDGWGLDHNIVIDTTGSVIYTGEEILAALKQRSRVVYLGVPDSEIEYMYKQYLADPKPVIWGDLFSVKEGEEIASALRRCYGLLLKERSKLYSRYADVTLIMNRIHRDKFTTGRLLALLGAK
jgi:shikimate kinase